MPITILPRDERNTEAGAGIGMALGALGGSYMRSRNREKNIQDMYNFFEQKVGPEEAKRISLLSPEFQLEAYQQSFKDKMQQDKLMLEREKFEREQQEKAAAKKEALEKEQRKYSHADIAEGRKLTQAFKEETTKAFANSKETIDRLEKMKKLNESGKLGESGYYSLLKKIGFDWSSLKGADAEEYDKLASEFVRGAKDIFGSRITDADLRSFFRTIPTLENSEEGRGRIINTLLDMYKAKEIPFRTMRRIVKDYDQRKEPLYDLREQVTEAMYKDDEFKNVASSFMKNIGATGQEDEQDLAAQPQGNRPNRPQGQGYFGNFGQDIGNAVRAVANPIGQALSIPARAGEQIVGALPQLAELGVNAAAGGLQRFGKGYQNLVQKIPGFEPTPEMIQKEREAEKKAGFRESWVNVPMTPRHIRQMEQQIFGNLLESDNPAIKFAGNVAENVASLANPLLPGAMKLANAGALGLGAEAAKELTKKVTGSEFVGDAIKGTSLLLGSIAHNFKIPGEMAQEMSEAYNIANKAIPAGATQKVGDSIKNSSRDVINAVQKGYTEATDMPVVLRIARDMEKSIGRKKDVPVEDLLLWKRQLNGVLYGKTPNASGVGVAKAAKVTDKAAIKLVNELKDPITKALQSYSFQNPTFGIAQENADTMFRGLYGSNAIKEVATSAWNSMPDYLKSEPVVKAAAYLYPVATLTGVVGRVGAEGLARALKIYNAHPTFRKLIHQGFVDLASGSAKKFVRDMNKISKVKI